MEGCLTELSNQSLVFTNFWCHHLLEKYADDGLFELDMKRHISETKAGKDDGQGAKRRKADLWSDGIIPYVIGPSLSKCII